MSTEGYPVDLETGEVIEPEIEAEVPAEEAYPQIYLPNEEEGYSEDWPEDDPEEIEELTEEDMDEEVTVDFTPKELLQYKLPQIDLFAPDKPKSQSKEKNIVRKNIRILEDTFKSFNIDVKVERAEIGPSVTKYEVKPAVGVRVNRISNLADDLALALAAKDVRIEAPILENLWLVSKCLTQRLRRFLSENFGNSPRRTLISSWKFLSVRQLTVRLVALIWVGCLTY